MPSVDVIPYDSLTMSESVKSWLRSRSLDGDMVDEYPEDTWVSIHGNQLIAAGALCKTNTPVALMIGFVTNPIADSEIRSASIDALIKHGLKTAEKLGFKQIVAWTENDGILKRTFDHGFKQINQIMIRVDLEGK